MAKEGVQQAPQTNRKLWWWFIIALIIFVLPWLVLGALD
jgi:hypothetical protein